MACSIDITTFWQMDAKQFASFAEQKAQFDQSATAHLLLHLSLLHSMVPNELLPQSEHMFLSPAWSLSLEWQFYLMAPFLVVAVKRFPAFAAAAALAGLICFKAHLFGHFFRAGLLPSSAWYFFIGIATRLHIDRLPKFQSFPWWLAIASLPMALVSKAELVPAVVWIIIVLYLRSETIWRVLDSSMSRALGDRSYSVYILHMPLLTLTIWLVWTRFNLSGVSAVLATGAIVIIVTALISEIVFRYVERPAIRWGGSLSAARRSGHFATAATV